MDDAVQRADRAKRGSPYLNTAQTAHFLGCSQIFLEQLRARGEGPVYRRHTRMIQYHIDDVNAWSQSRATEPKK